MNVRRAVEDVNYFLNTIMDSACTSREWDYQSLERAFVWALHCENLSRHASFGDRSREFNSYVQEIAHSFGDAGNSCVDLNYLQSSQNHLRLLLLQNPHLQLPLYEKQLETYVAQPDSFKPIEHLQKIADLKTSLKKIIGVVKTEDVIWTKLRSRLMLQNLWKQLLQQTDAQNSKQHLASFVELFKNEDGMKCLLHALCEPSLLNEGYTFLLSQIIHRIVSATDSEMPTYDPDLTTLLWAQPPELLCEVSEKHTEFYNHYMHYIVQHISPLIPNCFEHGLGSPINEDSSITKLETHLKTLLTSKRAKETEELLKKQPGVFWDDLLLKCKREWCDFTS